MSPTELLHQILEAEKPGAFEICLKPGHVTLTDASNGSRSANGDAEEIERLREILIGTLGVDLIQDFSGPWFSGFIPFKDSQLLAALIRVGSPDDKGGESYNCQVEFKPISKEETGGKLIFHFQLAEDFARILRSILRRRLEEHAANTIAVRRDGDGFLEIVLEPGGETIYFLQTPEKRILAGLRDVFGLTLKKGHEPRAGQVRPIDLDGVPAVLTAAAIEDPSVLGCFDIAKGTGRIGLVVGKFQPPTQQHIDLIKTAQSRCDLLIVCIGSSQLKNTVRHPFPWEARRDMLSLCLDSGNIRFLPLADIDELDIADDWVAYVLEKIEKQKLPSPTDYFTGSRVDARWYEDAFASLAADPAGENESMTTYVDRDTGYRLHVFRSFFEDSVSATELRTLIEMRFDDWKRYVPKELIALIDRTYPGELRTAIPCAGGFPDPVPPGTAALRTDMDPETRFELRENGKWVAVRPSRAAAMAGDFE